MKKYLLALVLLSSALTGEEIKPKLFYIKGGVGIFPTHHINPGLVLGLGIRHRMNAHGLDFSAQAQIVSLGFLDRQAYSASTKYLHYCSPTKANSLYFGLGAGINHFEENFINFNAISRNFISADGVIGYEIHRHQNVTSFIQLELAEPVVFTKGKTDGTYTPAAVFTGGFGF